MGDDTAGWSQDSVYGGVRNMSAIVTHPVAKVPFPEVKIHHFQLHEVVCRLRLSCCSPGIRLFP